MAATKIDPKELAIEAFYAVKELFEGLVADFKAHDKFVKYKLAVVGAWAFLSLGTMAVACPGGSTVPDNNLGAHVQVAMVLDDVSILVRNDSSLVWRDVRMTLNNQFTAFYPEIPPGGGRVVLTLKQFVGPGGKVPPKTIKPATLQVACNQGSSTVDLTHLEEMPP